MEIENSASRQLPHLGCQGNLRETRYGWLRLTPAYSVHLVSRILDGLDPDCPDLRRPRRSRGPRGTRGTPVAADSRRVLDPFCGTGTTALVCAERGITCDTTDINPFLIWLAGAKTRSYGPAELDAFARAARITRRAIADVRRRQLWVPPLHQIERWWDEPVLDALARAIHVIRELEVAAKAGCTDAVGDLLRVAFCRTMIERAKVSFGHQSMSFSKRDSASAEALQPPLELVAGSWTRAVASIACAARSSLLATPRVMLSDARVLKELRGARYSCVITSPPYPNRMSYIRELRPYMYWLGYLADGRAAGELDWQAIGGTWGCATSKVARWEPPTGVPTTTTPYHGFANMLASIAEHSPLLSRYVHKYFHDMGAHAAALFRVVAPGGTIHYVVGNSKFYDVVVPVERILAALFRAAGFAEVRVRAIRKRTSKKELFEYVVSAIRPNPL